MLYNLINHPNLMGAHCSCGQLGTQAGQMFLQIRGIFVTRITMQTSNFLIGISIKKDIKQFIPI
jgi:hypothetical protein